MVTVVASAFCLSYFVGLLIVLFILLVVSLVFCILLLDSLACLFAESEELTAVCRDIFVCLFCLFVCSFCSSVSLFGLLQRFIFLLFVCLLVWFG